MENMIALVHEKISKVLTILESRV